MEALHNLRQLLRSFVEKGPAGCSCSVTRNGETVFEDYVGFADIDTKNPISSDTIFRIYSMTKVVTCVAALKLYERGLYLLSDPIEEYLPEFSHPQVLVTGENGEHTITPATRSITIKDLFMMTSGLTYGWGETETERQVKLATESLARKKQLGEKTDIRSLTQALAAIPLAFDPGTQWQYGLSHDVLGALIEVLSGKSLGRFLKDEIFEPLAMNDTFFNIPKEKQHRLASLYIRDENGSLTINTEMDEHFSAYESGGGGLFSTLSDYSRFAHMLANDGELDGVRIIGRKTIELMATNHLQPEHFQNYNWPRLAGYGYGLGVQVMMDRPAGGSNSPIGEFGWNGLAGTWVTIDPKEKLSAVYMQQMLPNFEEYHQPRLRSVIYGSI
ncbi:serine hydrolase domain-containing protein [Neobacillus sp. CF12]|uniref:serine hydrolase domain-containing protein n=1 Tax=Neobacillus sp. CF12 TaxID=3055864 RepID=UPI0025A13C4B|nr:serine hydrolase domain-containing protein [Neobacillus sp. CF12]MDM5327480.1 serine hydrolase domain-containing protein [Neobacillus sp. CF12]